MCMGVCECMCVCVIVCMCMCTPCVCVYLIYANWRIFIINYNLVISCNNMNI